MKRHATAILVLVSALVSADAARAQVPGCGGTQQNTYIHQIGLETTVRANYNMTRDYNGCFLKVRSEGWIEGVGTASSAEGSYNASFSKTIGVPDYAPRTAVGKYWLIEMVAPWTWHFRGEIPATVNMESPPPGEGDGGGGGDGDGECEVIPDGGGPSEGSCGGSPILIDTAFDGYRLTSVGNGVRFDLDADGEPEQVAWTRLDSDDAWLAFDRNGNGVIDNGAELFGNYTPAYPNSAIRADNGFEALKFSESPAYGLGLSRADNRIDAHDAIFSRLLLWRDANHNGISEPEELTPASQLGLQSISTDYKLSKRVDRHGNEFRQRAKSFWIVNGEEATLPVFDVWLRTEWNPAPPTSPEP